MHTLLRPLALSALVAICAGLVTHPAHAQGVPANVWSLQGNRGTDASTALLGTTDAVGLRIGTNGIARILVGPDGTVQIGSVENPSDLDIFGDLYVSGVVTGASGAHFGGVVDYGEFSSSGLLQFAGAGNYGVGSGRYVFQTLDGGGALTGIGLRNSSAGTLDLVSGPSTVFSIDYANGNTDIEGTADIAGNATVGGNASVTGDASIGGNGTVTGNLGVGGTNSDPTAYALYVNGRLRSNGINELSDLRMKRDVATLDGALAKVLQLRGVRYEWRREEHPDLRLPAGEQVGLIAQEVEAVVPEVVHTDAEGVKSVEYAHLVAVLVEAVKEQQAVIERQAQALAEVQAEVQGLRVALDRPATGGEGVIQTASIGLRAE